MKAFLDHYGYQWMAHRPKEIMFKKQGICVTTAAGAGMKSTIKDMADSLFFWGVARIYKYGIGVGAINWEGVSEKKKRSIARDMTKLANKILERSDNVTPQLKTKGFFYAMHLFQRKGLTPKDRDYWTEKGWTGKKRPW